MSTAIPLPAWRVPRRTFEVTLTDGTVAQLTVGDVYDDDLALRYHQLVEAQAAEWMEDFTPTCFDSWATLVRSPDTERNIIVLASIDGTLAGAARAALLCLDNTDKAFLTVQVAAGFRRRGIGAAVLSTLEEEVPADRTELLLRSPGNAAGIAAHTAFATSQGYRLSQSTVCTRLALPVPSEKLKQLESQVGEHAAGYQLHTCVGGISDDATVLACEELKTMVHVEAPSGDIVWEKPTASVEQYRALCAKITAIGETMIETYATEESGTVVAYTVCFTDANPQAGIWQASTYVHPEHRGHRLGLAIKLATVRRTMAEFPAHRWVTTSTDSDNHPMIAVNELMGFVPHSFQSCSMKKK